MGAQKHTLCMLDKYTSIILFKHGIILIWKNWKTEIFCCWNELGTYTQNHLVSVSKITHKFIIYKFIIAA